MTALTTLTRAQIKVFLREPVAVGFGLVFPAVLLLVIGNVFPGATEVSPELGNKSLVEIAGRDRRGLAHRSRPAAQRARQRMNLRVALHPDERGGITRTTTADPTTGATGRRRPIGSLVTRQSRFLPRSANTRSVRHHAWRGAGGSSMAAPAIE